MYLVNGSSPEKQTPGNSSGALVTALARTPDLIHRSGSLALDVATAVTGRSAIEPERGDRRFTDPAWSSHPVYRRLSQAYLAVERAIGDSSRGR